MTLEIESAWWMIAEEFETFVAREEHKDKVLGKGAGNTVIGTPVQLRWLRSVLFILTRKE